MRTADVNVLRVETGSLLLLQMDADELLMRFMAVCSYVDLTHKQTNTQLKPQLIEVKYL